MDQRFRKIMLSAIHPPPSAVLAVVWILGLVFGSVLVTVSDDSYFLLMCEAANCPVSITGLIASVFLPFLISAFAVFIGKPKLIFVICFCQAAGFSFAAAAALAAFGSAGWLIGSLLLFSDICFNPVLCWFWIRQISANRNSFPADAFVCTAFAALIGSVDLCVVSPFLAMLIDI